MIGGGIYILFFKSLPNQVIDLIIAGAYEAAMTGLLTTLTSIPLSTATTISIL
ncbi:MAG: hypothetical protein ABEJ95_01785 [Candidatus Nanohalobium sp.]